MDAVKDRAGVVRVMANGAFPQCDQDGPACDLDCVCYASMDAALAALEAAGLRVVPVEATVEMLRDGTRKMTYFSDPKGVYPRARTCYRAMLAASPFAPPQQGDGT